MPIIPLVEPSPRSIAAPPCFALFALGFRPFYLLAAALALVIVPAWVLMLTGWLPGPAGLPALYWHGHEMIFGFAVAVIVGFLFTAAQSWTGRPTPTGSALLGLACVWLAGRIALLCAPPLVAAVIDLLFLPAAALMLARVLIGAGSRRNYFVLVILAGLTGSNALMHVALLGWIAASPLLGLHLACAIIATLCTVIAGRIVPSFTANALRTQPWRHPGLDRAAISFTAAALFAWALGVASPWTGSLAAVAFILQCVRCNGWRPWVCARTPLLWILHLSHGWLLVGLAWLALASLGVLPIASMLHLITLGCISGLIIAMITRTSLGHTGRKLVAGPVETACYGLMQLALLARVLPPLLLPEHYQAGLVVSALAWVICFGLYLYRYAPMLWYSRVDGKPG